MIYLVIFLLLLLSFPIWGYHLAFLFYKPRNIFEMINITAGEVAHRGCGKRKAPGENTMAGFHKAKDNNFKIIELDVRISKDNEIIVFHGPNLNTTTDGEGRVENKKINYLKTLNWAHYLNKKRSQICTLKNVLNTFANSTYSNIELKRDLFDFSRGLEEKVHEIASPYKEKVFYSSFHWLSLLRIKKIAHNAPLGLLLESGFLFSWRLTLAILLIKPDLIHSPKEKATKRNITRWKKKNLGVLVWTINERDTITALRKQGVDFVVTDLV